MRTQSKYWMLAAALMSAAYADAGDFNPLVGNPFVFCSSPRPCKHCQPWRKIYSEICDSQNDAKQAMKVELPDTAQEEARNRALTEAKLNSARLDGADALNAAVQRGDAIFLLDEYTPDPIFNAFAAGWNFEWSKR